MSKADAARIFANALLSDYYESTYLSGDAVNFVCTGTVLEVLHNAGKVTGVALEAGNCSLTTDFAAAKDEINIGGAMFKTGGKVYRNYVGTSVTAYFDLEDKNEIKFLCDSGKNNIVTLNAKDLVSATLEKITYEADGAEKSYRINGAEVMLNGSKKPYPEDGDLFPAAGTVTLVDNDNDNKFEVVKVMSYQTMLVGSANSADNSVTDKYTGQKVIIGDEETADITYENGAGVEMTFADIAPGMVLLYAVDEGGKNVRVLLCDDKVSGNVNKISKDGITVGSAVYSFSAFYENAKKSGASWVVEPVVGQSYTLYLSPFGEIAFLEKGTTSTGSIYGILMRAGSEDKVLETEIVFLEVFNHLGEKKIYQLAEKVKLNGKTGVKAKDVLPQVAGFKDKVLKLKTNGDGAVSELETPVLRDNLDYSMLGKEFNMIDLSQKLGAIRYKPTSLSFNFRLGITAQTIVFNTTYRDDGTLDEKLTTVMQGSGFELEQEMQPAANSRDNVICYGISRDGIVSVVTKGPNSKNNINPTFLLVTGISQALDANGNVVSAVEGIANAQKVTYTIDEDDTTTLSQLSVGCIACVLVNSENEIEIRESDNGRGNLVWDKNKITGDGLDFYGVKSSSGDVMYSWVLMGRVFEYKNDVLMVTTAKTIDK